MFWNVQPGRLASYMKHHQFCARHKKNWLVKSWLSPVLTLNVLLFICEEEEHWHFGVAIPHEVSIVLYITLIMRFKSSSDDYSKVMMLRYQKVQISGISTQKQCLFSELCLCASETVCISYTDQSALKYIIVQWFLVQNVDPWTSKLRFSITNQFPSTFSTLNKMFS